MESDDEKLTEIGRANVQALKDEVELERINKCAKKTL
jgi:hypothetical protein